MFCHSKALYSVCLREHGNIVCSQKNMSHGLRCNFGNTLNLNRGKLKPRQVQTHPAPDSGPPVGLSCLRFPRGLIGYQRRDVLID